jgi:threonine efflux protein
VDYLTFALVMLLAQFSPGPDMLLLLKNAVNHPLQAGLWTVVGIVAGLTVHTTLALTGVSLIIRTSSVAAGVLNVCGGLYLGWLAFHLLRSVWKSRGAGELKGTTDGTMTPLPARDAFLQGLITNLLNPKAALFLLGVLAACAGPDSTLLHKLGYAAIILGQALVFWSLFVWLLQRGPVRRLYLNSQRLLNLFFGLGLATLAVMALLRPFIDTAAH